MGNLVFQAALGGQVAVSGPNTASSYTIAVPTVNGTFVTTGDTATVTSTMISGPLSVAVGGTGVTTSTGSGSNVLSTSPTLVTPILGTPTSGTLTNCTGLPNSGLVNSTITIGGTSISLGGSTSAITNDITIHGLTVGLGGGSVSTNTAFGTNALAINSSGNYAVAVGYQTLTSSTTASNNTALGYTSGYSISTSSDNVFVGYQSGFSVTTGTGRSTAIGSGALYTATTGTDNTVVGYFAGNKITTGSANAFFGSGLYGSALSTGYSTTTGSYNTGLGNGALASNTTASNNTAVGYQAGYSNTTSSDNTFIGYQAGYLSTGNFNTAIGRTAYAYSNSSSGTYNNAIGSSDSNIGSALGNNTSGSKNNALGNGSLASNTSGSANTAVGHQALVSNITSSYNTAVGYQAGYSTTGANNTFIGQAAGYYVTSGAYNTILGEYTGNQGGLDIRTASNRVVLSDGNGNPRIACDATGSTANGYFMAFDGLEWYPGVDNAIALGTASKRYTVVYATTALINTSDANLKQQICNLSDAEKSVATKIKGLIKSFKFNDSVAKKGDGARIHIGVIAQDVQSAFIEQNLDPNKYAMFCSDTWYEVNGSATLPNGEFCKKDDEGAVEVTQLGIRYEELLAFVLSSL